GRVRAIFFFFQAEDGIRDKLVTGVQTCALPIFPDDVELMVDYNQALTFVQALERGRALDSEGVAWIEEPIRHDDFRNCAELARELATPIQIGENFSLPEQMREAILARASDFVMPDLERIGGVSGWQRAATLAAGS